MRGQDSTLTVLLPLESFGSLIRILNLLISTDSSSVVSFESSILIQVFNQICLCLQSPMMGLFCN